jgi:hypothetical protein
LENLRVGGPSRTGQSGTAGGEEDEEEEEEEDFLDFENPQFPSKLADFGAATLFMTAEVFNVHGAILIF